MNRILSVLDTYELIYICLFCFLVTIRLVKLTIDAVHHFKKKRQQERERMERLAMPVDWQREEKMILDEYIDQITSQRTSSSVPNSYQ
jgi:hypothetical protein